MYSVLGCAISSLVFGIIVIIALLSFPIALFAQRSNFNLKAVEYYGCHWNRACGGSLSMALLASFVIIVHVVLFFKAHRLVGWTAGLAIFLSVLSIIFNVSYSIESIGALRDMEEKISGDTIEWEVLLRSPTNPSVMFQYNLTDWGKWFSDCNDTIAISNLTIEECIGPHFAEQCSQFTLPATAAMFFSCIGGSLSITFFVNPKPLRTLGVLLILSGVALLFALPIYSSVILSRGLAIVYLEICETTSKFSLTVVFAWLTTILIVIGWMLVARFGKGWLGLLLLLAGFLELGTIANFSGITTRGNISPSFQRQMAILTLTAVPHFLIWAALLIMLVIGCLYACFSESDDGYVVVFVKTKDGTWHMLS